jgi:hypothetical protein
MAAKKAEGEATLVVALRIRVDGPVKTVPPPV